VGKYRKVALPRDEVVSGIAPGHEYPVFQTRFGKVGMMVCYDGFFPEVARQLSNAGAEVIAWPVWGCNPDLAKARAVEKPGVRRQQYLREPQRGLDAQRIWTCRPHHRLSESGARWPWPRWISTSGRIGQLGRLQS